MVLSSRQIGGPAHGCKGFWVSGDEEIGFGRNQELRGFDLSLFP
jgi:hypothetical protein